MIERIASLIEKAAPGPWTTDPDDNPGLSDHGVLSSGDTGLIVAGYGFYRAEDAAFVAHARQLLPLMYEVVKEADGMMRTLQGREGFLEHMGNAAIAFAKLDAYCAQHLPKGDDS